jgi:hypothetical protein
MEIRKTLKVIWLIIKKLARILVNPFKKITRPPKKGKLLKELAKPENYGSHLEVRKTIDPLAIPQSPHIKYNPVYVAHNNRKRTPGRARIQRIPIWDAFRNTIKTEVIIFHNS